MASHHGFTIDAKYIQQGTTIDGVYEWNVEIPEYGSVFPTCNREQQIRSEQFLKYLSGIEARRLRRRTPQMHAGKRR